MQWGLNNMETPRSIFHSFSLLCLVIWSLSPSSNGAPWRGRGPVSLFSSLLSPFYLPQTSHTRWVSSSKWRIIFLHLQKLYLLRTQIWCFENLSLNRSWYLNPVNFLEILAPYLNVPRAILAEIFRRQKFTSPQNFEKFQAWKNWIGDRFHHHLLRRGWADACTAGLPAGKQWLYFHIVHYAIRQNYIFIIVPELLTVNWCSFKSGKQIWQILLIGILHVCCL